MEDKHQSNSAFLNQWVLVDLTHPISTRIPIWDGDPSVQILSHSSVDIDGYNLNKIIIGEHSGTHFGCPRHFLKNGRGLESYRAEELVRPAVVIDIREIAQKEIDYSLNLKDIVLWEKNNGRIPSGSVVLLSTGWDLRWENPQEYFGLVVGDDHYHWPGFSVDTFLIEERGVVGLGTDTHGIDPGVDKNLKANTRLFQLGCFHLENLRNLNRLPTSGAILVIGVLPIENSTGSPARIFALLPRS